MRTDLNNTRSGHSFLCLVAIYVIHILVFHVYSPPEMLARRGEFPSLVRRSGDRWSAGSINASGESPRRLESPKNNSESGETSSRIAENGAGFLPRDASLCSEHYRTETTSGADTISVTLWSGNSRLPGICTRVYDSLYSLKDWFLETTSKTSTKVLSPAAWGALVGCLVFLFTYTDREKIEDQVD